MKWLVVVLFAIVGFGSMRSTFAETRSAKDMQAECRVALDVLQKNVEPRF
jgi:hypothetical protein